MGKGTAQHRRRNRRPRWPRRNTRRIPSEPYTSPASGASLRIGSVTFSVVVAVALLVVAATMAAGANVTISGRVSISFYYEPSDTLVTLGLGGVFVRAVSDDGNAVTVATSSSEPATLGAYRLDVPTGWSGTLTPLVDDYPFWNNVSPGSIAVVNASAPANNQDFTLTHSTSTQWRDGGLTLGNVRDPESIAVSPDGTGGALVAWREGDEVRAQRVDASGDLDWNNGGITLSAAGGDPSQCVVVGDGFGGADIVWMDRRAGSANIYARRVGAWGDMDEFADGRALVTLPGDQVYPLALRDGLGNLVVAYTDAGAGNSERDIRAALGTDPPVDVAVCTAPGAQYDAAAVVAGGEVVVAWTDERRGQAAIYAQRIDGARRETSWERDGAPVCRGVGLRGRSQILFDGQDGTIVVWEDERPGSNGYDIYAQRIDVDGEPLWQLDGLPVVAEPGAQRLLRACNAADGDFYMVWADAALPDDGALWAQRFDSSGAAVWAAPIVLRERGGEPSHVLAAAGGDELAVVWREAGDAGGQLLVQRVRANGTLRYGPGGRPVTAPGVADARSVVVHDGTTPTGAFVVWQHGDAAELRVARNAAMETLRGRVSDQQGGGVAGVAVSAWAGGDPGRVTASTATNALGEYRLFVECGWEGVVVPRPDAFYETFEPDPQYIFANGPVPAEHFTATRKREVWAGDWPIDGRAITGTSTGQRSPVLVAATDGGALAIWIDGAAATGIAAARVTPVGGDAWPRPTTLCATSGARSELTAFSDGADGAIAVWVDTRSGSADIYAQRIDADGRVLWQSNGVPVCRAPGNQRSVRAVPDGGGGAYVVWCDERVTAGRIYASHIGPTGAVVGAFPPQGLLVTTSTADQAEPDIARCDDGAVVVWQDDRGIGYGFTDIYAQRITALGERVWEAEGVLVCDAKTTLGARHYDPRVVSDGGDGAVVAWIDTRHDPRPNATTATIYAARVKGDGTLMIGFGWIPDGVRVSEVGQRNQNHELIPDGVGGVTAVWQWNREVGGIRAQRINGLGMRMWPPELPAAARIDVQLDPIGKWPRLASDRAGGVVVVWEQRADIRAQCLDGNGKALWVDGGAGICLAGGTQLQPSLVVGRGGVATVAWEDQRAGASHVYAQRVEAGNVVTSVNFDLPVDEALWTCPQGDAGVFRASVEFSGRLIGRVPHDHLRLAPPTHSVHFFDRDRITAADDITGDETLRTSISHAHVGGCGEDTVSVLLDGVPIGGIRTRIQSPDLDGDGSVGVGDFGVLMRAGCGTGACGDFTGDGCVDEADFSQFVAHYGHAAPDGYRPQQLPAAGRGKTGSRATVLRADDDVLEVRIAIGPVSGFVGGVFALAALRMNATLIDWLPATAPGLATLHVPARFRGLDVRMVGVSSPVPVDAEWLVLGVARLQLGGPVPDDVTSTISAVVAEWLDAGGGEHSVSGLVVERPVHVSHFRTGLAQNHPNPFNPSTTIGFSVANPTRVTIVIHDVRGRPVRRLVDDFRQPGDYTVDWDGVNDHGDRVATGVYFYRMTAGPAVLTRKMNLIK